MGTSGWPTPLRHLRSVEHDYLDRVAGGRAVGVGAGGDLEHRGTVVAGSRAHGHLGSEQRAVHDVADDDRAQLRGRRLSPVDLVRGGRSHVDETGPLDGDQQGAIVDVRCVDERGEEAGRQSRCGVLPAAYQAPDDEEGERKAADAGQGAALKKIRRSPRSYRSLRFP